MRDLIRRSDAVKELAEYMQEVALLKADGRLDTMEHYIRNAKAVIRHIPSADRPQGWIPCSERLPDKQGHYLVTFPLCNGEPWVYILSFNKGKFYETDDEWGDVEYDDVTAWMPLPKPYKEKDDEDN